MSDNGFRISRIGVDVKTGDDKDMVITSKYPLLKGSISGTGEIEVVRDGSVQTITIAHNLGYIPMVQAFWNDVDEFIFSSEDYYPMPYTSQSAIAPALFRCRADSVNIYLDFSIDYV